MHGKRLGKYVYNMDVPGGRRIVCAWADCEADGVNLYLTVVHDHSTRCDHPDAKHPKYLFCSERHKMYWVNSHRNMWNLPAGSRNVM